MGETTAVAHGGDPQDRAASPRPRCLPKTALHRFCNLNIVFSSFRQLTLFHSDFWKNPRVLDFFITTNNYTFSYNVSPSAYPSHYSRRLLLTQSFSHITCG
ncbi:hypothetical protein BJP36_42975 [Moorena producens JHB]|uniref:Uncharacterized protein n=1 Tax=Moorena producens (strain JHB) TaxID=1454205 RepID=A0A9Q9ST19_MOOP1|nr:hypothetical protein [Moorena producens]WAN69127.1 hypothetical protein BJP36_42975 [Moorena producens JHB]